MTDRVNRRRLLASVAAGPAAALAGCPLPGGPGSDHGTREESAATDGTAAPVETGGRPEREERLERIETLESQVRRCDSQLETLRGLELEATSFDERPFVDDTVHDRVAEAVLARRASVVAILLDHPHYEDGEAPPATGWVYDDGLVATNQHVAAPGDLGEWEVSGVQALDGDVRDAAVLASDRAVDAALLETSTDGLDPFPVGRSEDLRPGDPVAALGHPSTVGRWVGSLGAYRGEHTRRSFVVEGASAIGNSGSPLLAEDGTVVGMLRVGGAVETFPEELSDGLERSDFRFHESASCSSAVFERYPPRRYVAGTQVEHLVDRFEEWRDG